MPRTAASVSVVPECLPLAVEYAAAPDAFASVFVGVGQHEDALSLVWSSDVAGPDAMPLRIVPERGQVPENSTEGAPSVPAPDGGDVLHDREAWS